MNKKKKKDRQGNTRKNNPNTQVKSRTSAARTLPGGYYMLFLIAFAGLINAAYLTSVHLSASKTCGAGGGCSEVLSSPWATMAGIPVAVLGSGMFLALAWFAVWSLLKNETRPLNEPWMFFISGMGVGVSVFLTALQAGVIGHWCMFCLFSAGLTTAFFLICLQSCLRSGSLRGVIKQPELLYKGLPWALLMFILPSFIVLTAGQGLSRANNTVSESKVAAVINGREYTLGDIDRAISAKLQQLDERQYKIRKKFLEEEVIALEASRQNLTPRKLIHKQVLNKITVEPDEVKRYIRENRSKLPDNINKAETRKIKKKIRQKKVAEARADYVEQLKKKYDAQFSLPMPQRVDIKANPRGGPVKGPEDAPITIILFTDLECPFCRKAHKEMYSLMDRFPGKIRLAFRHFPLEQHKWARKAAEFAYCAQQQGRFWPFVDSIFGRRGKLTEKILYTHARKSGISDLESFNQCIRSSIGENVVAADIGEGKMIGVQYTPSLFINGRFFTGIPKNIDAIIQEEIDMQNREGAGKG